MAMTIDDIRYPDLTRRWRKYYRIVEVDRHLARVVDSMKREFEELPSLHTQNDALRRENSQLSEKIASLQAKVAQQEYVISEQGREIGELGNQLTQNHVGDASQSAEFAQQSAELVRLQARIERLNEQISFLERRNTDEMIEEAVRKADQIVSKAMEDSDKILMQVNEQRTRLITACRAAYYNALQFKRDLADRFRNMEQELDSSIDVLHLLDNSRLVINQMAADSENNTTPS